MSYSPNNKVVLLAGAPVSDDYCYYPSTLSMRNEALLGYAQRTFQGLTFIGPDKSLRIPLNADIINNCNALMYQNLDISDHWHIAIIDDILYRGQDVSQVVFHDDDVATWIYDAEILPGFIERETVANDNIGLHTIPESIEVGPLVETAHVSLDIGPNRVIILSTEPIAGLTSGASTIYGIPVNVAYGEFPYSGTGMQVVREGLQNAVQQGNGEAIIAIYLAYVPQIGGSGKPISEMGIPSKTLTYTPRNNKLNCYPFVRMEITTPYNYAELLYELTNSTKLKLLFSTVGSASAAVIPTNYAGKGENPQAGFTVSNYPNLPWTINAFQNYIANNKFGFGLSTAGTIVGGITSAVSGNVSGVLSAAQSIGQTIDFAHRPDQSRGSVGGDVYMQQDAVELRASCMCAKPEYMAAADAYFDVYGYRVNRVGTPNLQSRPNWNYIKCSNPISGGKIPEKSKRAIQSKLQNGYTFWHTTAVGDYTLSNK